MNKQELVKEAALLADMSRTNMERALFGLTEAIMNAVTNGDKVMLVGFGCFDGTERREREGRNPQTGEPIVIPAKIAPRFKAGKEFRDRVMER